MTLVLGHTFLTYSNHHGSFRQMQEFVLLTTLKLVYWTNHYLVSSIET